MNAAVREISISDVIECVMRHRALAAAAGIGTCCLVLLATFRVTPLYEATATLAIEPRAKAVEFEADTNVGYVDFSMLNTTRDKLQARSVIDRALERSGLNQEEPYASAADPTALAQGRLLVQISKYSLSLKISYQDELPERGRRALSAILDAFHEAQLAMQTEVNSNALKFLSRSKLEAEEQLARLRASEQRLRSEYGLADDASYDNIYTMRLRRLSDERTQHQRLLASSAALLSQVEEAGQADDPIQALLGIEQIARDGVVSEQRLRLSLAETEYARLGQKYLPKHPRMVEISETVDVNRRQLEQAVGLSKSAIEARGEELLRQGREMDQQIAVAEQDLEVYQGKLAELRALQKEVLSAEQLLNTLREQLSEQQVLAQLDASRVSTIDPPSAGSHPVNIRKSLFLLAALASGAVAALFAALVVEALGRRIHSPQRAIEISQVPLLGQVPYAADLKPAHLDPDLTLTPKFGEAIRALRARIRLSTREHKGPKVLLLTSACPGDGKTSIAAQLASSLAALGDRVLLIEGDLRAPSLGRQFGVDGGPGLAEFLAGAPASISTHATHRTLRYMIAGSPPPNPAELLEQGDIRQLTHDDFEASADWIIMDSPPLGRVSDALALANIADYVLLVVREDRTLRSDLRRTIAQLAPLQAKVLGMIYNGQRRRSDPSTGYGYGYGEYGTGPLRRITATSRI